MKKIKSKTGKARKHTKILKHQKIIGLLFSSAVLILPLIVRLKIKSASQKCILFSLKQWVYSRFGSVL